MDNITQQDQKHEGQQIKQQQHNQQQEEEEEKEPKSLIENICIKLHPNKSFTHYVRNNFEDNSGEFYTTLDYENIVNLINNIDTSCLRIIYDDVKLIPFKSNSYIYVDTEISLRSFCNLINENTKIIGIDIEQTMHNSYQGYVCLIQISTINQHYIIDAIKLHDIIPIYMKNIFQNPNIIKVFYAGMSDLMWLNRDFGIFVVNYFDVYYAKSLLISGKNKNFNKKEQNNKNNKNNNGLVQDETPEETNLTEIKILKKLEPESFLPENPKNIEINDSLPSNDTSLVGMWNQYCNHNLEKVIKKKYQVLDWRIRPLTQDQLDYACLDAYFLIYLRNELLRELVKAKKEQEILDMLKKMQQLCLKKYELRSLNLSGFEDYFIKEYHHFKKQADKTNMHKYDKKHHDIQLDKFLRLVEYRDRMARKLDENPDYVCRLHDLMDLALYNYDEDGDIRVFLDKFGDKLDLLQKDEQKLIEILLNNSTQMVKVMKNNNKTMFSEQKKIERRQIIEQLYSAKKTVYEDCQLLAPDNELLCYCNLNKINWYLKNNIAELVNENPKIIRLKFEPDGRGLSELNELKIDRKEYIHQNRKNQCVVCGKTENLLRYHVVPKLYRQFFPLEDKAHRAHDVILLCFRCLEKANREADKYKLLIAGRYNIPLHEYNEVNNTKNALENLKKILINYTKNKYQVPEERRKQRKIELRKLYENLLNDEMMTDEFKQELKNMNFNKNGKIKIDKKFFNFMNSYNNFKTCVKKTSNKDFKDMHGKGVVESFKSREELKKFIEEWRVLFLETLDPQFLPSDWHIALKARAKMNN